MAGSIRAVFRVSSNLFNNYFARTCVINGSRNLYTDESLGVTAYENTRFHIQNQFLNVENTFRTKMKEICSNDNSMVFTEDLKAMLHLVKNTPEDLELITNMLKKYSSQNSELRFGTFAFGPVVMRTFYHLDQPDLALTAFNDPLYENFFDQSVSYQLLLNLLLKHKRYTDVRNAFDKIISKKDSKVTFPRNCLILATGACYEEKTPEALEYALNVWKKVSPVIDLPPRKAVTFIAKLAIDLGKPEIALEIITSVRQSRYIAVRCIKILAYLELKRYVEIIPILRSSLTNDRPQNRKETYFSDVIQKVEDAIAADGLTADNELVKLIQQLKTHDFIIPDTLENNLLQPINRVKPRTQQNNTNVRRDRFNRQSVRQTIKPSLRDLL